MTNLLTSPVGEIQFMAVGRPVENSKGIDVYSIRLAFDSKKDADWISQIAEINANKPVTADTYRGKNSNVKTLLEQGKTLISAETKFPVKLYDKQGNELEEAPMFFSESKGTAQMIVQPYTKSKMGGTINLVGVIIHELEGTETSGSEDRESKLAQLKAVVEAATKK